MDVEGCGIMTNVYTLLLTRRHSRLVFSLCIFVLSTWNFHRRTGIGRSLLVKKKKNHHHDDGGFVQNATRSNFKGTERQERRRLNERENSNRVLYTVTSLAEYDNGKRSTQKGYDRFRHTLLPVLRESATSIQQAGYTVDVYLIAHYTVNATRYRQLLQSLPSSIGLYVWDDATPLGYVSVDELGDKSDPQIQRQSKQIMPITRALARQHRYVIKDKLLDYDVFVSFEDDMLIHGAHVQNYVDMTNELYRLRRRAPEHPTRHYPLSQATSVYYGDMTRLQLSRMIPGFIRVEVTLPDWKPHKRAKGFAQVPITYQWNETDVKGSTIDPSICCHVNPETAAQHPYIPTATPPVERLHFWETSLDALSVRKMPDHNSSHLLDWVLLQTGNDDQYFSDPKFVIGEYWMGRDGYFLPVVERPNRQQGDTLNNQGGWMATRRQIFEWHRQWCRGGAFLPPYNPPVFSQDGLRTATVEYWSGGIQMVGVKSCNLQRVIALQPDVFGKHLLYHTSNNKQRQKYVKHRLSATHIRDFWGQLNTVKRNAERAMLRELQEEEETAQT